MKIAAIPFSLCSFLLLAGAHAQDIPVVEVTEDDRTDLSLTIYNNGIALVRDRRSVHFANGENKLDFADVSANIRPVTAALGGQNLTLIEQNFDFDLLTPQKLIEKGVGEQIRLYRAHPTTGEDSIEVATIIAANDGVVLQVGDRIEVLQGDGIPGRLVFDRIPPNLRAAPTLSMLLDVDGGGERSLDLSYLTSGLAWRADYVGLLSADEIKVDLQGWVTLGNVSGVGYQNAQIQLIAGSLNLISDAEEVIERRRNETRLKSVQQQAASEALFDYHLYTLPRRSSIANNQTKQVALLSAPEVGTRKEYVYHAYGFPTYDLGQAVEVNILFDNTAEGGLGLPMPKGVVRLYKKDSRGNTQFIGEDSINHTPEGQRVRLRLGEAFDVTVKPTQVERETLSRRNRNEYYETVQEYIVANAKDEVVEVLIEQNFYYADGWTILEETLPHESTQFDEAVWKVSVPPKGQTILRFKVRVDNR